MTEINLLRPSLAFEKAILTYKSEFGESDQLINGARMLHTAATIIEWLTNLSLYEDQATLPNKKYVPGYQFILVRTGDHKILGMSHLRTTLNEALLSCDGHIGYSICPSERGRGYGKLLLEKTLIEAKRIGIARVLVTCDETNIGSEKVIIRNNGRLENRVFDPEHQVWVKRFWIDNAR